MVCEGNVCQPATCDDGIKNGNEHTVDCGPPCPLCSDGTPCASGDDCASLRCESRCMSCHDSIKSGSESDIDCGGPCALCDVGRGCATDADCLTGNCPDGTCA